MSTLLLKLCGPMQAWGDASRFTRRDTRNEPSKSGVLGLLAAAQGRRRTDPLEDLASLRFGVRVDQEGTLLRDFQTAIRWESGKSMPLSYRYYLSDAVFLAAVEGHRGLLEGLRDALAEPRFPLYLGRRSCAPSEPVLIEDGLVEEPLEVALANHPWLARPWYRERRPVRDSLRIVRDAREGEVVGTESVRDVPLSFDPERREYGWRDVVREDVEVDNPEGVMPRRSGPDFFAEVNR